MSNSKRRVIYYYTPWCGHCADARRNIIVPLQEQFPDQIECIDASKQFVKGLTRVPTIFLQDGDKRTLVEHMKLEEFVEWLSGVAKQ